MSDSFNARHTRYGLYALGGAFVALGFALEAVPVLIEATPALSGRICAGIGAAILIAGRFGSDHFVRRFQRVLTRGR
jgi:hypothetical protein